VSTPIEIHSDSAERTRRIGEALGRVFTPGDVVVLDGDLGAGKTTFTQGIARGMGIDDPVTSPTFVVAREMPGGAAGVGTHAC
jgi:tRNA threonylcarbamoyl adenosine modification protein YjeE